MELLKLAFWIIVSILVLSFFGFSLEKLVQSPIAQQNFSFFFGLVQEGLNYLILWLKTLFSLIVSMVPRP